MQLTNANIRKGAKQYYEEHIDEYQDARDESFSDQFRTWIEDEFSEDKNEQPITEDDVQGFLNSFEFKDEDDWISDMYESYIGDLEDKAYDSYKDDKLERDY